MYSKDGSFAVTVGCIFIRFLENNFISEFLLEKDQGLENENENSREI